jgi:hypothetical protein
MGARIAMMRLGETEGVTFPAAARSRRGLGHWLGFTLDDMSASGGRQQPVA